MLRSACLQHWAEIVIPKVPNFLRTDEKNSRIVGIDQFSNEELETIGTIWTNNLIARSAEISGNQDGD